jgi:hypothetical protein
MNKPTVTMEIACCRITTQSSERERIKLRFSKALARAKTWFSMWKSCKTMAWTWLYGKGMEKSDASGMSGRYCGFRLPMVRSHRRTCQRQCVPRVFETACIPLGPEDISWWKICLSTDVATVHTAKTPSGSLRNSGLRRVGRHIGRT